MMGVYGELCPVSSHSGITQYDKEDVMRWINHIH